jgi:hypothetical protein
VARHPHADAASPVRSPSIGRWRRDLDPKLQRIAEQVFAPALELFGYERSPSGA